MVLEASSCNDDTRNIIIIKKYTRTCKSAIRRNLYCTKASVDMRILVSCLTYYKTLDDLREYYKVPDRNVPNRVFQRLRRA